MCYEYGWTLDEVFNCTKAEIGALMNAAIKRKNLDLEFTAKIHGAEIKGGGALSSTPKTKEDFQKLKSMGLNVEEK